MRIWIYYNHNCYFWYGVGYGLWFIVRAEHIQTNTYTFIMKNQFHCTNKEKNYWKKQIFHVSLTRLVGTHGTQFQIMFINCLSVYSAHRAKCTMLNSASQPKKKEKKKSSFLIVVVDEKLIYFSCCYIFRLNSSVSFIH